MISRGLRLKMVASLALGLVFPALAAAQTTNTTTTVNAASSTANSCTLTTLSVAVTANAAIPTGTVAIYDSGSGTAKQLATATLSSTGKASLTFDLADGAHTLYAVYAGTTGYGTSTSASQNVNIASQCSDLFVVSASSVVNNTDSASGSTLTPGQSGTSTITVVPSESFIEQLQSAGSPGTVELSCSGLPDQSTCTFSTTNLTISNSQYKALTSSMVIQTVAASTASLHRDASPIAWAFLLPGILGLGGIAFSARRNKVLRRLSMLGIVAIVTVLGTAGCNPRYSYENHGPVPNAGTAAGTYTVKVTGQYSDGVTATTRSSTTAFTVK